MKSLLYMCLFAMTSLGMTIPDSGVCVVEFKEHKIVVVPTVIVFNDGEEVERFQANIMMQLEATQGEVQDAVDGIIMSAF